MYVFDQAWSIFNISNNLKQCKCQRRRSRKLWIVILQSIGYTYSYNWMSIRISNVSMVSYITNQLAIIWILNISTFSNNKSNLLSLTRSVILQTNGSYHMYWIWKVWEPSPASYPAYLFLYIVVFMLFHAVSPITNISLFREQIVNN